jgi:molecular chaperone GrpE
MIQRESDIMNMENNMTNGEERRIPVGEGEGADNLLEKDEDFSQDAEPVEEMETSESEAQSPSDRIAELEDRLLRAAADFDNYRKRTARQTDEAIKGGNDRLLGELLEIVDNFERAMQHADADADPNALKKGMELIYSQLQALLVRYGVTPIEALGQKFDPAVHDAMMQVESDAYDEGVVASEMTKGYRRGDQILRHSKVGVSCGTKRPGASSEKDN